MDFDTEDRVAYQNFLRECSKMRYLQIILVLIVNLLPSISYAEKSVWSIGWDDCGSFLAYCEKSKININCEAQTRFVMGYISGISVESSIFVDQFSHDGIKYALIKFCQNNPLRDTSDGAGNILGQLK